MAPLAINIPDLDYSSLELDAYSSQKQRRDLPGYLASLSFQEREALAHGSDISHSLSKRSEDGTPILSPIDSYKMLTARITQPSHSMNPAAGGVDPNDINMKAVQAAFALIGVSFVVGAIWFFFWAKNGGFQWRRGDWDEYKSTVLRRRGPNGTTLSNATKSTKLGGGSVVGQGYSDDGSMTATDFSSEAPIFTEKRSKKKSSKKVKEQKMNEAQAAKWEGGHDTDVRAYRHEKAARVGGLNTQSDAQYYGTDYTQSDASDMNGNGNRKPSRQASPDKRQPRRDFSYGNDAGFSAPPPPPHRPSRYHSPQKNSKQSMPGSYVEPMDFSDMQSQNTKSYAHPMPGLGGQGRSGGYRRDRRDSLDD